VIKRRVLDALVFAAFHRGREQARQGVRGSDPAGDHQKLKGRAQADGCNRGVAHIAQLGGVHRVDPLDE
jgi:hypothetical protein